MIQKSPWRKCTGQWDGEWQWGASSTRVVREGVSKEPQVMTATSYDYLGKKVPGGKSSDVQTGKTMACLRARKKGQFGWGLVKGECGWERAPAGADHGGDLGAIGSHQRVLSCKVTSHLYFGKYSPTTVWRRVPYGDKMVARRPVRKVMMRHLLSSRQWK